MKRLGRCVVGSFFSGGLVFGGVLGGVLGGGQNERGGRKGAGGGKRVT